MSSQGHEDAVLARLFAAIGTTNQVGVEFGARDGVGKSNTHRLRVEEGWTTILFDREPRAPIVRRAHLTAENINAVFFAHGVPPRIDLLSIDVDGMDFWLWKALTRTQARVVVIEYNSDFGPDQRLVRPYDPAYRWDKTTAFGASAAALVALGREKGYTLVDYVLGTNLIFVQDTVSPPPVACALPPAHWCGHRRVRGVWEAY